MKHPGSITLGLLLTSCLTGCAAPSGGTPDEARFSHPDTGTASTPWTHERFEDPADRVSFAVFSDLTGGERPGVFARAVAQLNLLRPELVVSVGDLIEGDTADRAVLATEWADFDDRALRSRAPLFRTGGNHDLGHPVMWDVWNSRYGPRHYHFVYRDVLFLVLDTEDNPPEVQRDIDRVREDSMVLIDREGWDAFDRTEYSRLEERVSGRIGAAQADYFIDVIEDHPDVRWTFVLLHKPAWKRPGEENFTRIEAALANRNYTVFNGHEHFYEYRQRHGRDYIQLGTTGGFQPAEQPLAVDHVTLVTVWGDEAEIANIRLSGLFDRHGQSPE